MIAEAAHELGLEGLTLREVAAHLGVSIAALYHHVSNKDDLLRLAAEYTASRLPLPEDRGQHWSVWLYEWACYNRDAFLAQPGLLARFVGGAVPVEAIAGNVEAILAFLVRQGFSVVDANEAYELVTSCAVGTVVGALREGRDGRDAGREGDTPWEEPPDSGDRFVHLRALAEQVAVVGREPFHRRVGTVVCGIAVRRGEDWAPIDGLLARAAAERHRAGRLST
jgi:AcrR family transcriptional regulator